MSLYLKIDQDENFEFFEKYEPLSPLRKKIWKTIVGCARKWIVACPSQSKIAKWCECSRSAVSEAFKLFKEWSWLTLISRGFKKSKTLLISTSKKQIDIDKRNYFKRVEATYRATHIYPSNKKLTGRPTGEIEIPHYLRKKEIPLEAKLKLSLISERTYIDCWESLKKKAKTGWKPDDELKYFTGTAIQMAIDRGEKLDWRKYYKVMGQ